MRLRVAHVTGYRFEPPARGVVQSLRLTPANSDSQRILDWSIDVPGAMRGAAFRDSAGDWVETATLLGPVEALAIRVSGLVETTDLSGILRGHRESVPPLAYLTSTRMTRPDRGLAELAADAVDGIASSLDRAHALAGAISDAIVYRPGTTRASTTGGEALGLGEGVCQDFTHALVGAALSIGVPARYVTGYLLSSGTQVLTSGGQEQQQGQTQGQQQTQAPPSSPDTVSPSDEASHAWAELHVEGFGWVGFDASNRCCPDERYVRLASGFDAMDAAPVRGIARGQSSEDLEVRVSVEVDGQQ